MKIECKDGDYFGEVLINFTLEPGDPFKIENDSLVSIFPQYIGKPSKLSIFPKDTGKPLQFTDAQKSVFQNFIGNVVCWRHKDGKVIDGGEVAKVEIDDDGKLSVGYKEDGDELWPILITPDDVKDIVINNEGVFINTEKYQYVFS